MCAVFGYLDYKGKVSNAILKKLIQNQLCKSWKGCDIQESKTSS